VVAKRARQLTVKLFPSSYEEDSDGDQEEEVTDLSDPIERQIMQLLVDT
jgi:hypothetical protein